MGFPVLGAVKRAVLLVSLCEMCLAVRVFTAGDAGVTCFRIPAIVATPTGALLAFAEARHGSCADDATREIALRRSTDGGLTWSAIQFVAGNASLPVGNPYPIADATRVALVVVLHADGGSGVGTGNGVARSADDGATWTALAAADFGAARGALPGPGAGLASGGRWLVISHLGAYVDDYVTLSDDAGASWRAAPGAAPFASMDEAVLADLGGGELIANFRHAAEPTLGRGVSRSFDGGLSWSNVSFDAALVGPVCQGALAVISPPGSPARGALYFSNPASATARANLTVRRSDDGGRTWGGGSVTIQAGVSSGYSSLLRRTIIGDDARSGILYEATDKGCIDFSTFPLAM